MELSDGWRAIEATEDLRRAYYRTDFDDRSWAPITVPGHWGTQQPFTASDGPLLHRCQFSAPRPAEGRRAWLTYEGIFYQGDHWIDGIYLGDTEGYFLPHTMEVTEALRTREEHVLSAEITCAPQHDHSAKRNITGVFQHWDCLDPDWNPGGIWRPVRLTETGPVRIQDLRVICQSASAERATLALRAVLDSDAARTVRIHTALDDLDQATDHPVAAGENTLEWTVTIDRPKLWWPHALGLPNLYDVTISAQLTGDEAARATDSETGSADSDQRTIRTGLRSIELRNWICTVNGERLFLKGSNQGPTRMDLGHAMPPEVSRDVELAVHTGLDMLRVHGHISRPELYTAADEAGLLLWQDFPLQWGYARNIRREAVRQAQAAVSLLGQHPSVFLWCAHNEPMKVKNTEVPASLLGKLRLGRKVATQQQLPTWNKTVLDGSLKRTFERADGSRPVIPHSGVIPHPPRFDGTDSHLYFGWYWGDERQFPGFLKTMPRQARFVSEFGAQAIPSGDGADWMEPHRWPYLDWDRLGHTHGLQRTSFERYVPPNDYPSFDAWRDATQRYQATVIKHHIETLRRLKYRPTGGFAHFCFADGHPAVSWSVLDHERRPKLGYDALRAACRPVIAVADRLPEHVAPGTSLSLDVHVVSDRHDPLEGVVLRAQLSWMGGGQTATWTGDVPADSCVRVGRIQAEVPETTGALTLDVDLQLPDGEKIRNRYESLISARR